MKLKDLVMQVTYEEIEPAIESVFSSFNLECNSWRKDNWRKVYDTLRAMEPAQDCDMTLKVVPCDVSGYYDKETLKKHPDYQDTFYSLVATSWRKWLGMKMDEDTLKKMSVPDILGNCIYEMTWWGYDEETIQENMEKRLGYIVEKKEEKDAKANNKCEEENGDENEEVDAKTQCKNFIKSFIPVILPSIADKCDNPQFEQTLQEAKCSENGAYCEPVNLKAFGLPLTSIAFFYLYLDGACMFGVSTDIEGQTIEIVYGWFAPSLKDLKTIVETHDCQDQIIEILTKQVEETLD